MFPLLLEVHFWTFKDKIFISNNELNVFKYHSKNDNDKSICTETKKKFAVERGYSWTVSNKKPLKLKHLIKELEEYLEYNRIVSVKWLKDDTIILFFSSGVISFIQINLLSGDITNITFDKYVKDKLSSSRISDALMTDIFFICCYNDPELTLVYYTKMTFKKFGKKISDSEPKLTIVTLPGPNGKRLCRKLCVNKTGDVIAIWWKHPDNDIFPWSPLVKDVDRANILIYSVIGSQVEILCYHRTEFDLMSVIFSSAKANILYIVEQIVSCEGNINVENSTYEILKYSRFHKISTVSISLRSNACCIEYSPDCNNLLLGCVDGSIILYNQKKATTHIIQTSFVPSVIRWHYDGCIVAVASDRGQLQCFDFTLSSIKLQILSEDITPNNIIDFSVYFNNVTYSQTPTLTGMEWNVRSLKNETNLLTSTDSFLLLTFNGGPLVILRILSASSITAEILVEQYLSVDQIDKAINLLFALDWESDTSCCLSLLQIITNNIFVAQYLTPVEKYYQIKLALQSSVFIESGQSVETEYYKPIRNISRRVFHFLMRHEMSDLALDVATYLNEHDLFMDLYYFASNTNNFSLQTIAWEKAEQITAEDYITNNCSCDSESCNCSYSNCSSENVSEDFLKINDKEIMNQSSSLLNTVSVSTPTHTSYASVAKVISTLDLSNSINFNTCDENSVGCSTLNEGHKKLNDKYSDTKELVPNSTKNLSPNFSDKVIQGWLSQTRSSNNKIVEPKNIRVVHFGVV